jgi:hypothetical protein
LKTTIIDFETNNNEICLLYYLAPHFRSVVSSRAFTLTCLLAHFLMSERYHRKNVVSLVHKKKYVEYCSIPPKYDVGWYDDQKRRCSTHHTPLCDKTTSPIISQHQPQAIVPPSRVERRAQVMVPSMDRLLIIASPSAPSIRAHHRLQSKTNQQPHCCHNEKVCEPHPRT